MKDITNIKVWTKLTKRFSIDKHASVDSYLTLDLLAAHPHFKTWQCCCKAFLFCFLHLSRIKAWFQIVWLVLEGGVRFKVADVGRDCISIPACENCHSSAKKMCFELTSAISRDTSALTQPLPSQANNIAYQGPYIQIIYKSWQTATNQDAMRWRQLKGQH